MNYLDTSSSQYGGILCVVGDLENLVSFLYFELRTLLLQETYIMSIICLITGRQCSTFILC